MQQGLGGILDSGIRTCLRIFHSLIALMTPVSREVPASEPANLTAPTTTEPVSERPEKTLIVC